MEYPSDVKSKGLNREDIPEHIPPRFWSRINVRGENECWPWNAGTRNSGKFNYGDIGFGIVGTNYRQYLSHVVAFVLTKGDVPPGMCVLHECDNPPCCNPKHLRLGTQGENNTDRNKKGREGYRKGTSNGRAVLNEVQVIGIREEAKSVPYGTLAKAYGVSTVTIAKIVQRKLWRHIA